MIGLGSSATVGGRRKSDRSNATPLQLRKAAHATGPPTDNNSLHTAASRSPWTHQKTPRALEGLLFVPSEELVATGRRLWLTDGGEMCRKDLQKIQFPAKFQH